MPLSPLGIFAKPAGAPTSPVAGYTAWYDASDTATISVSGSAVTQWNDKSANAYNLTQSTAAQRPSSGVNTLNGKNVITFDGNDVLQAATASNWTFMSNSTGCTIFMVIYCNTDANYTHLLDTAESTTANVGVTIQRGNTDTLRSFVLYGSAGNRVSFLDSGTLADATASYFSIVLDNSNATAANRAIFKINGGSNLTGNTDTNTASSSAPKHPLYVGSYDTAGSGGFSGRIAEILIYSGVLSSGDIASNNSYLAAKWGL